MYPDCKTLLITFSVVSTQQKRRSKTPNHANWFIFVWKQRQLKVEKIPITWNKFNSYCTAHLFWRASWFLIRLDWSPVSSVGEIASRAVRDYMLLSCSQCIHSVTAGKIIKKWYFTPPPIKLNWDIWKKNLDSILRHVNIFNLHESHFCSSKRLGHKVKPLLCPN